MFSLASRANTSCLTRHSVSFIYLRTGFLFAVGLPVTRSPVVNAKVREAFRELLSMATARGWGEYRTAPAFYELVMDVYSFNDHAMRHFLETIKDAVDPNGIMSPGRYAIRSHHHGDMNG